MARTCHKCKGYSERYNEAHLKRCAGCQKVFYCSTECQKDDWIRHIFDCNPRRPVTTADYIALAVHDNILPEHPQTCVDYWFNRAVNVEYKMNLLGLYADLIKRLKISPKTMHQWQASGEMGEEIKAAYRKIGEGSSPSRYFSWFLQNEQLIAHGPPSGVARRNQSDTLLLRTWRFIGGSESDIVDEVNAAMSKKTEAEQDCFLFYNLILSQFHPSPEFDIWVKFGFASCTSSRGEMLLGGWYQKLIDKCSFKEFFDAHRDGGLFDLFRTKGLPLSADRHLQDILTTPAGCYKSVWYLKQFVHDRADERAGIRGAVMVDYGFINCRDPSERRQLKRVYKAFFETHKGDPLELHEAAMKGGLHGFLSQTVKGLRDPKFQRLMKNPPTSKMTSDS